MDRQVARAPYLESNFQDDIEGVGIRAAGQEEVPVSFHIVDEQALPPEVPERGDDGGDVGGLEVGGADPGLEEIPHQDQPLAALGRQGFELIDQGPGVSAGPSDVGIRDEGDQTMESLGFISLWRATSSTTASATRRKASACGPSGSATTIGTPASPPSTIFGSSGIAPR